MFYLRYELRVPRAYRGYLAIGRSVAPRETGEFAGAVLVYDLDRNADDLNVVIRSLSPRIRSVNVLRHTGTTALDYT